MRFRTTSLLFLAFAAVFFITSCDETDKNGKALSTPTSGELNLSVDETLSPIFKEELIVFNQTYPQAKIKVNYESEFDAITDFRNKKSTMLVLGRKLTQEENAVFEQRKLPIKYTKIAYDAIALIINKDNPNKEFKYEVMENIFSGKINNWTDADGKTSLPITVVFDDPKSSIFGTICNRFKINKTLPKTFFGLHSNPEVIDYVSKNKGAIGIIGVNWISNYKVKAIQEFNAKIDVAGVYNPDTSKFAGKSYKPYQAFIATKEYPLIREIYTLNSEGRNGLATGFTSFVAGERGQAIIQKACLMPVNSITRLVHVRQEPINNK